MIISEIYQSRQGEGLLTGKDSIFVRTSGCNLRCWFCDTPFTSWEPEGKPIELATILDRITKFDCQHVVITGGEPMLQKQLTELTELLAEGTHITIETAGTIYQSVKCDLMSISPKMKNSTPSLERAGEWQKRHEQTRHRPKIIQRLINDYDYQLKFVVDQEQDVEEILSYLEQFDRINREHVLLMPQGTDFEQLLKRGEWVEQECDRYGFTFCPRRHIEWYGNKRGT